MGGAIFDIERFDGNGDYFLWKQKLKAILMQQKVDLALEEKPEFPATMTTYEKKMKSSKLPIVPSSCTCLIMCLGK